MLQSRLLSLQMPLPLESWPEISENPKSRLFLWFKDVTRCQMDYCPIQLLDASIWMPMYKHLNHRLWLFIQAMAGQTCQLLIHIFTLTKCHLNTGHKTGVYSLNTGLFCYSNPASKDPKKVGSIYLTLQSPTFATSSNEPEPDIGILVGKNPNKNVAIPKSCRISNSEGPIVRNAILVPKYLFEHSVYG